jgi:hypothetical protein
MKCLRSKKRLNGLVTTTSAPSPRMPLPVILGQFLFAGVSFGAIQPPLVCVRARAYVCATLSLSLSLHHHHHPLSLSVAAFGCVRSALSLTNPRYTVDSVLLVLGYVRACVCICFCVCLCVCQDTGIFAP